jgi:hypothetical protein
MQGNYSNVGKTGDGLQKNQMQLPIIEYLIIQFVLKKPASLW